MYSIKLVMPAVMLISASFKGSFILIPKQFLEFHLWWIKTHKNNVYIINNYFSAVIFLKLYLLKSKNLKSIIWSKSLTFKKVELKFYLVVFVLLVLLWIKLFHRWDFLKFQVWDLWINKFWYNIAVNIALFSEALY